MASPSFFPGIVLPSTAGRLVNLRTLPGLTVVFIYPFTGRPDYPNPEGWDGIAGAHGSTPQALGYKALYPEFKVRKVRIFGMSFQSTEWQKDFVKRNDLPFALLSDEKAEMALELDLEVFTAGQSAFLRRRTFILRNGQVLDDRKYNPKPANDAAMTLNWIKAL